MNDYILLIKDNSIHQPWLHLMVISWKQQNVYWNNLKVRIFVWFFLTLYLSVEHPDWFPALIGLSILLSINNIPTVTSMISTWRQKKAKRNTTQKNRDTYNYNHLSDGKQNIVWPMPPGLLEIQPKQKHRISPSYFQNSTLAFFFLTDFFFFFKSQYKKDSTKIKRKFIFHRSGHHTKHTWM